MSCRYFKRHFADYMDGELPDKIRARLDEHVRTCAECRADVELDNLLAKVVHKPIPPCPPDIVQRAKEKIRARESVRRTEFRQVALAYFRRPAIALPAALVALVVMVAIGIITHENMSPFNNSSRANNGSQTMGAGEIPSVAVMAVVLDATIASTDAAGKMADLLRQYGNMDVRPYMVKREAHNALLVVHSEMKQDIQQREQILDPEVQKKFWPPSVDAVDAVVIVYLDHERGDLGSVVAVDANGRMRQFAHASKLTYGNESRTWLRDITSWLTHRDITP